MQDWMKGTTIKWLLLLSIVNHILCKSVSPYCQTKIKHNCKVEYIKAQGYKELTCPNSTESSNVTWHYKRTLTGTWTSFPFKFCNCDGCTLPECEIKHEKLRLRYGEGEYDGFYKCRTNQGSYCFKLQMYDCQKRESQVIFEPPQTYLTTTGSKLTLKCGANFGCYNKIMGHIFWEHKQQKIDDTTHKKYHICHRGNITYFETELIIENVEEDDFHHMFVCVVADEDGSNVKRFNVTLVDTDRWLKNIDGGKLTGVLFIDPSKAFDTVNHNVLLYKLKSFGLCENSHMWYKSYLLIENFEKMFGEMKLRQARKWPGNGTIGVSVWFIIGSLLFILYVNDYLKDPRYNIRYYMRIVIPCIIVLLVVFGIILACCCCRKYPDRCFCITTHCWFLSRLPYTGKYKYDVFILHEQDDSDVVNSLKDELSSKYYTVATSADDILLGTDPTQEFKELCLQCGSLIVIYPEFHISETFDHQITIGKQTIKPYQISALVQKLYQEECQSDSRFQKLGLKQFLYCKQVYDKISRRLPKIDQLKRSKKSRENQFLVLH